MKRYFILLVAQVMASVSMMAQVMNIVMKDGTVKSFPTKDITYMKMLNVDKNGHEYVDLGLSVYWATCNVGANAPEEDGDHFAWGETVSKEEYSWSTYRWDSKDMLTKYCTTSNAGTVDNKTILDPEDDVAHVKWGGSWRMPTEEELKELCIKCTLTWTTQNDKEGYKVTGPNGNSIFLPAAGYYYDTTTNYDVARYWSSSLSRTNNSYKACHIYCSPDNKSVSDTYRNYGCSVRPVCP